MRRQLVILRRGLPAPSLGTGRRALMLLVVVAAALAVTACNPFAKPPPPPMPDVSGLPEVTLPSGLKYIDIVEGQGPTPRYGGRVVVHYTGWLTDGTQIDTTREDNIALEFAIGKREVIRGWEDGVLTMKVGGKRRLIIPPSLAYGAQGRGNIPPDATLIFDIELLSIK